MEVRWGEAFESLDIKDQATLAKFKCGKDEGGGGGEDRRELGEKAENASLRPLLDTKSLFSAVDKKRKECDSRKWTLFKRSDGREVKLRDVLDKMASWIRRFETIGDSAVQFDAGNAALPWAAVKFLIEVSSFMLPAMWGGKRARLREREEVDANLLLTKGDEICRLQSATSRHTQGSRKG